MELSFNFYLPKTFHAIILQNYRGATELLIKVLSIKPDKYNFSQELNSFPIFKLQEDIHIVLLSFLLKNLKQLTITEVLSDNFIRTTKCTVPFCTFFKGHCFLYRIIPILGSLTYIINNFPRELLEQHCVSSRYQFHKKFTLITYKRIKISRYHRHLRKQTA